MCAKTYLQILLHGALVICTFEHFMEAEWELTKLEKDGVIYAVVSEDSDLFVLGCKVMIQLLDINVILLQLISRASKRV